MRIEENDTPLPWGPAATQSPESGNNPRSNPYNVTGIVNSWRKPKMRRFCFFLFILAEFLILPAALRPCTSFVWKRGEILLFGSNYDNSIWQGRLFINQKNVRKQGWEPSAAGAVHSWTSRYGSVTFSVAGLQLAWAGMNEAGLVLSTMALSETRNPNPDERPPLRSPLWMQYLLDTCASIDEVIAADKTVRISETQDHYLIADASGRTAVVEFLEGKTVFHSGDMLPIPALANKPYDACVARLGRGLPSTVDSYDSAARMKRVFDFGKNLLKKTADQAVDDAFAALKNVSSSFTQWSIVFDIPGRTIHFLSSRNPNRRWIELRTLDFTCGKSLRWLDVHADMKGDISRGFAEYDPEASAAFTLRFLKEFGLQMPESDVRDLLSLFESFTCNPKRR